MPWKATLGDRVVDMRAVPSADRVAMHQERPPFQCPGCGGSVSLRAYDPSTDVDPHRFRFFTDVRGPFVAFAHHPGAAARCHALGFHGDESVAHLDLKESLCDAARAKGWDAEVEVYHELPSGDRCRADVLITHPHEKPRVLEAQLAPLGPAEAIRRSDLYREAFGTVLWTHTKRRPWSRRLPSLQVDNDDQHSVVGGIYLDASCTTPAAPLSLEAAIGEVLPPSRELTWIWAAEDFGGFVRLLGAQPPRPRRRPARTRPAGDTPTAGLHVRECGPGSSDHPDVMGPCDWLLRAPDGVPWCRFGLGTTCLNGTECLNPNHRP